MSKEDNSKGIDAMLHILIASVDVKVVRTSELVCMSELRQSKICAYLCLSEKITYETYEGLHEKFFR